MKVSKMRKLRFFKGMTLDDIYLLTGRKIDQGKLSRIERNIQIPSKEEKTLISGALKTPQEELFPEESKK